MTLSCLSINVMIRQAPVNLVYPADTYRHHHVLLEASFLKKPRSDERL